MGLKIPNIGDTRKLSFSDSKLAIARPMDISKYRKLLDLTYHSKRYSKTRIELQNNIVTNAIEHRKIDYSETLSNKQW